MRTLAFFNNKGGVGKTALAYHLAWMFAELEVSVLVADLDPQANLTSLFLSEERLLEVWEEQRDRNTIFGAVEKLQRGVGDIQEITPIEITNRLSLVPGSLSLSRFEDSLSESWGKSFGGDERSFRVLTSFHRVLKRTAEELGSQLVLLDVGPNLGAINRAALLTSDHVVFPVAPDLFSLQGLQNLGPTLSKWRKDWGLMVKQAPPRIEFPAGDMEPSGYVLLQHGVYSQKVVRAYVNWAERIPTAYHEYVLEEKPVLSQVSLDSDPECLAKLKHYKSLMPLAMEARKPIFFLKTSDGAIGAHIYAVQDCYRDFKLLAETVLQRLPL